MVGWPVPITTVLPSDRTVDWAVDWTVGALEGPGAPV
jgi:hypothetical protein